MKPHRQTHPRRRPDMPTPGSATPSRQSDRLRGFLAIAALTVAVLLVYCPLDLLTEDCTLIGGDYFDLHQHRIGFAQDALFASKPHLPAWYPRELLGTPFWSNVQNFPFIPTRLALLAFDRLRALPVGVNLAAILAAIFTYLYCRQLKLSRLAAIAAGWTFACAGFFACRIMVGHLPLLEAYPALPLLLWLIERAIRSNNQRHSGLNLLAIALGSTCVVLAGHPQLSVYSFAAIATYLLYRGRNRQGLHIAIAIALGVGLAGFVLWPMLQLIGRSTRVLALDAPDNNIVFPYWRLTSFLFPWKDGWPVPVDRGQPIKTFAGPLPGYNDAYFWDTVCYVGWAPLIAAAFLLVRAIRHRRLPAAPWPWITALGILALVLALPVMQNLISHLPGTLLRSPSRQLYLTTFSLALALGVGIDALFRFNLPGTSLNSRKAHGAAVGNSNSTAVPKSLFIHRYATWILAFLFLSAHAFDLYTHARSFVYPVWLNRTLETELASLQTFVGDARVAIDVHELPLLNRKLDDVGFFDSIMLARPYRALLDLTAAPPGLNTQVLSGSELNARTLAYAGVQLVITHKPRPDLKRCLLPPTPGSEQRDDPDRSTLDGVPVYAVPHPSPRAAFIPLARASFLETAQIHQRLRNQTVDVQNSIMLPADTPHTPIPTTAPTTPEATVAYLRPSGDRITATVITHQPGFLRILESWDPGWHATVDNRPVQLLPADDFVLAIPLKPGTHQIHLSYSTPGAFAGVSITLLSLLLLVILIAYHARTTATTNPQSHSSPIPDRDRARGDRGIAH
jgi:hypothetical protein